MFRSSQSKMNRRDFFEGDEKLGLVAGGDIPANANDFLSNNDDLDYETHYQIMQETTTLGKRASWISITLAISFYLRQTLFILYARTFFDNDFYIGFVVFSSYVLNGILTWLFNKLGNKWRYDNLIIICALFDIVAFWLEGAAWRTIVLTVAYIVGGQPILSLLREYCSEILPRSLNKQIGTMMVQLYVTGTILGMIFGGAIAYEWNYRMAYYTAAGFAGLTLIYSVIFIFYKQRYLTTKQATMVDYYKLPQSRMIAEIDKFPVCLNIIQQENDIINARRARTSFKAQKNRQLSTIINAGSGAGGGGGNSSQKNRQLSNIINGRDNRGDIRDGRDSRVVGFGASGDRDLRIATQKDVITLWLVIIQYSLVISLDAVLSVWYIAYLDDKYDANIFISCVQLALSNLFVLLSSQIVNFIATRIDSNNPTARSNMGTVGVGGAGAGNNFSPFGAIVGSGGGSGSIGGGAASASGTMSTSIGIVARYNNNNITQFDCGNFYVYGSFFCYSALIVLYCYCITNDWNNEDNIDYYFLAYMGARGVLRGILYVNVFTMYGQSVRIYTIKSHSKPPDVTVINQFVIAFNVLMIGFLWKYLALDWLWYFQAGMYGVSMIVLVVFVAINIFG